MHLEYPPEQTNDFHLQIFIWAATEATFQATMNTPQAEYTKLFIPLVISTVQHVTCTVLTTQILAIKMHLNKPVLLTLQQIIIMIVFIFPPSLGDQAAVAINQFTDVVLGYACL